jgi:iron complex outermembrane recepter protein
VWSYELGEKARLLDGAVAVRASAFYIDWKNVHQNIPLSCGYDYTANAGAAVSKGGELEFDARLSAAFTVHGGVGYTDAKITAAIPNSALAVGARLPNVPEWTANGSIEYIHKLTSSWEFSARADAEYIGSEFDPKYARVIPTIPRIVGIDLQYRF